MKKIKMPENGVTLIHYIQREHHLPYGRTAKRLGQNYSYVLMIRTEGQHNDYWAGKFRKTRIEAEQDLENVVSQTLNENKGAVLYE